MVGIICTDLQVLDFTFVIYLCPLSSLEHSFERIDVDQKNVLRQFGQSGEVLSDVFFAWHKLNERNVFQKCLRTQYLTKFIKLWRGSTKTDSERCQMRKFYIWNFHWESIWFLKFIFKDLILYSLSNSPPPVLWISNLLENTHDLMVHKISLKLEASSAVRITLWENPWGRLFMWSDVRNTLQLLQLAITILIFYVVSPRAA